MEADAAVKAKSGPALLRRLGFSSEPVDARFCWRLVAALLALYAFSFAAFYPRITTNHDEANYIRQARLVFEGSSGVTQIDAFTGEESTVVLSTYPLGTALYLSPFVAAFGWRGAFAAACLCVVALVLLTACWIQEEKRSPIFAALMLGFPAVLVLGRVAMSDVPSGAFVALGLWLFWRGQARGSGWWLASGFVAGASWAFRASNPVLFVPLFAGTVLRREWKAGALVVGGLAGIAVRFLTQQLYFGDALFERSLYKFAPETLGERLPLYLLGTLVFIPGGLVLSLLYKGRRRPEILTTIVLFFSLYLFQTFSSVESSFDKRVVLALRYLIPLLPIMVFAMAESTPRLWRRLLERSSERRREISQQMGAVALTVWLGGLGLAALVVHPAFAAWTSTQAEIHEAVDRFVPDDAVLVTNYFGTKKFLREFDRKFKSVSTWEQTPEIVTTLAKRHGQVFLMFMDRTDSPKWRDATQANAEFLAGVQLPRELLADIRPTSTDRLRIWRVTDGDPSN